MSYDQLLMVVICTLFITLISSTWRVEAEIGCPMVTQAVNACSTFITYGSPDPLPGSPCCNAMAGLKNMGESIENRQSICKCIMGLINAYDPNGNVIATLPGFCGVSFGFTIEPNVDCSMYASHPFSFIFSRLFIRTSY